MTAWSGPQGRADPHGFIIALCAAALLVRIVDTAIECSAQITAGGATDVVIVGATTIGAIITAGHGAMVKWIRGQSL